MPIDTTWLSKVRACEDIATRDTYVVNGVEIVLPVTKARGRQRVRDWQRRLLPDIIPDSVNADAPERTPFRLLYGLTTSQKTKQTIQDVLEGELAPLESVFRAGTATGKKKMTLAFHVLAVKAATKGESEAKGFTERTILLLCRKPDGSLDEQLLKDLVEQFRRDPSELDLAQRTLLNRLLPDWTPEDEPTFHLPDASKTPEVPFDAEAARLFQEDVRSLLAAGLPPADFFHQLNLLFTLHLGLYQPRVATLLNPQMDYLFAEMEKPSSANLADLETRLAEFERRHPFFGLLKCRAPDPELRRVTLRTPSRVSFETIKTHLAIFHFNVLLLGQLRRLGEAYLSERWEQGRAWRAGTLDVDTASELAAQVKGPRQFLKRMSDDADFGPFLRRALAVLGVRFVHNQIAESAQDEAFREIERAPSALHALRKLYERYNIQSSRNAAASRAYRQGIQITSSLLQQGQYGLVQSRQRVGAYFEVGANILPLLLLIAVGAGREKIPVDGFWHQLAEYGLSFDDEERERLLSRLRAMGVYERYSDAGEAAYVRNLMMSEAA